eukprot:m.553827 g.553827  ORF g.553827 m.553827 type:complete len:682 (-) comp57743_c0_seq22:83-2128(-)
MRRQVERVQHENVSLADQLEQMQADLHRLQQELRAAVQEAEHAQKDREAALDARDKALATHRPPTDSNDSEQKMRGLEEELRRILELMAQERTAREDSERNTAALQAELGRERTQRSSEKELLAQLQARLTQMEGETAALTDQVATKDADLDQISCDRDALAAKLATALTELQQALAAREHALTELHALLAEKQKSDLARDAALQALEILRNELEELEQQRTSAHSELLFLRDELAKAEKVLSSDRSYLGSLFCCPHEPFHRFAPRIQRQTQSLPPSQLQEHVAELVLVGDEEENDSEAKQQAERLQLELTDAQSKILLLESRLDEQAAALRRVNELEDLLRSAIQRQAELDDDCTKTNGLLEQTHVKITGLEEVNATLQRQYQAALQEREQVREELKHIQTQLSVTQRQLDQANRENAELRTTRSRSSIAAAQETRPDAVLAARNRADKVEAAATAAAAAAADTESALRRQLSVGQKDLDRHRAESSRQIGRLESGLKMALDQRDQALEKLRKARLSHSAALTKAESQLQQQSSRALADKCAVLMHYEAAQHSIASEVKAVVAARQMEVDLQKKNALLKFMRSSTNPAATLAPAPLDYASTLPKRTEDKSVQTLQSISTHIQMQDIPTGWEEDSTSEGLIFYTHEPTNRSTWVHPRFESLSTRPAAAYYRTHANPGAARP